MKLNQRAILVALGMLCVLLSPLNAQQKKKYKMLTHKDPSTPQGMEGGMWRTDANFESILQLKNVLINHPLRATPILYMEDGTEYDLPAVSLEPAGVASVNITTALNEMPAALAAHRSLYGMVGVKYNWSWIAMSALVRNIDEAEMVSFHSSPHADVNESHSSAAIQKVQQIEGIWWKPYVTTDGFLFLSNTFLKSVQATVSAYDSSGNALGQKAVTLNSHASTRVVLSDILGKQSAVGMTGSLKITYQGPENGLSVVGGLEDDSNGYSATLNLQEMHPENTRNPSIHQVVLDAPGVMIGQQEPRMQFPQNTIFTPYGYLHNASAQARQVSVTATVLGPKGPQNYSIDSLALGPNTTQQIDYQDILKNLSLPPVTSIDISVAYTGNDEDIQVEEGSIDQTGNYVFEVLPQTEGWSISRTICHWELHDETDSMISLWNYSTAAEDLKLTLFYTGGTYVVPIHLEPRADYELDLATLVHSAQPDASGAVIPQSITEGSAILADAHDEGNHILVASSSAVFNVRTATCSPTCQNCNGISEIAILPLPIDLPLSSSAQAQAKLTYNTGGYYTTTTGSWSASNTAITTVNTGGLVNGVAVGQDTIYDEFGDLPAPAGYICILGSCPVYNGGGSGGATVVACPSTLTHSTSLAQPLAPYVPNLLTGVGIIAVMQVGPSTTNWNGTQITESISQVSNTCPASIPPQCPGNSTFTVGQDDGGYDTVDGAATPAIANQFYDNHTTTSATDYLAAASPTSCSVSCQQQYTCAGKQIGPTFTITRSFTQGVVGPSAVTNVNVTKTP